MSLATMYTAKAGSPKTTLAAALAAADTSMTLTDASVLPSAPNLAVIGSDSDAEVVSYTAVTGNVVSGLVRGLGGTVASAWTAGEEVARNITSLDHDTFRENILDLDTRKANSSDLGSMALISDVSSNNKLYGRKNAAWAEAANKYQQSDVTYTVGTDYSTIQEVINAVGIDQFGIINIPEGTYAGFSCKNRNMKFNLTGDVVLSSKMSIEYATVYFYLGGNLTIQYATSSYEFSNISYSVVFFGSRSSAYKTITFNDTSSLSTTVGLHVVTSHVDVQYTNIVCTNTRTAGIRLDGSIFMSESGTLTASGTVATGVFLLSSIALLKTAFTGATAAKSMNGASMYKIGTNTPEWS